MGEGGGGGGAREGVTGDDSISLGGRWRSPGKHYFSLSLILAVNISGDPDGTGRIKTL